MVFAMYAAITLRQTVSEQDTQLISVARAAVRAEVLHKTPPRPVTHSPARAVFVTIERNGKVLGCRGDLTPRFGSLEEEVIEAARSASVHDPRYRPLSPADLKDFLVTVTVVSRVERIANVATLQPTDGLVLDSGGKKGIVLPLEGKDPAVRLEWAYRKAGVAEGASAVLYRLTATRCRG